MKNRNLSHKIPDIDIIDLEETDSPELPEPAEVPAPADPRGGRRGILSRINIHIVLLVVAVVFVGCIVYKIANFGVRVDLDEIFSDGPGEYSDTYDTILPLIDKSNNPVYKDFGEGSTILALGNAPFADDRSSEDNLANLIQKEDRKSVV